MKTKEKKGKAIIGIAMAAIMVASLVAMVTLAAAFVRDARVVVPTAAPTGPVVVIGELITLPAGVTLIQSVTPDGKGGYIPTGQVLSVAALDIDTAVVTTAGVYMDNNGRFLMLTDPKLDVRLQLGAAEVSRVTAGQRVDVVVDSNIPDAVGTVPPSPPAGGPNDLKLRMIGPDGVKTTAGIGAPAAGAPAGTMWSVTTSGLKVGHYEFSVETYTTGSAQAAIEIKSVAITLSVLAVSLGVNAEPTTQVVGNDIVITTTSNPDVCVIVTVSAPGAFDTTKGDYPTRALPGSTANIFNARMPSDGTLEAVISSTTTGAVTIRATVDNNCNWRIDSSETTTDTIDVTFITVPSSPQNLQATAGDGYVDLSWNPPSSDGGSPITGYKIYRGTALGGERFVKAVGNVLTYTDNDVTNNQKCYYQISAVNSVGEGEKSNEVDATPTPTPTTAITTTTPTSIPTTAITATTPTPIPTTAITTTTPTPIPTTAITTTTPTPIPTTATTATTPIPTPGPDWKIPLMVALIGAVAVIIAALINYLASRKTR